MENAPATGSNPLINRNFGLLWIGQAISSVGDTIFTTTLVLLIATVLAKDQPWAPLAVGGTSLAALIPTFLIGPVAGVFVDRWDKRRTMLLTDLLRAGAICVLLVLPLLSGVDVVARLALIYAVVFIATAGAQFFNPSRLALIGDLVPPEERPRASGLIFMTLSLGLVVGPPLAAPIFFGLGIEAALILNALSFVVSYAAISLIRAPEAARSVGAGQRGDLRQEFLAGLRFTVGNPTTRTVVLATAITIFGTSSINALNVFFLTENLHEDASMFGGLGAASGIGLLATSPFIGPLAKRIGATRTFWLSTILAGMLVLAYARLTNFAAAAVMLALLGIAGAGVNVSMGPLLLGATPRELLGRVMAVLTPTASLAGLLSVGITGWLSSTLLVNLNADLLGIHVGRIDAIFMVAGLLVIGAGAFAAINLRPAPEPPTPAIVAEPPANADTAGA